MDIEQEFDDKISGDAMLRMGDLILCAFFFFLYILVFNTLLFRFGPGLEDIRVVTDVEWLWAAQGRWGCLLLRYFMGGGACYPASGLAAGFMLAIAMILQTKLFGIRERAGQILYGMSHFFCFQWVYRMPFASDIDSVAFSVLFCTLSVYLLVFTRTKGGMALAIGSLCLGLSGYQSCAFYYGALLMFIFVLQLQDGGRVQGSFIIKLVMTSVTGLILYCAVDYIFKLYVPSAVMDWAKSYQAGMTGYGALKNCCGAHELFQLFYHEVLVPIIKDALGLNGGAAARCYPLAWCGGVIYAVVHAKRSQLCNIGARIILLVILIVLPFATTLLLFSVKANLPRVWMAQPLVFAGVWALLYRHYRFTSGRVNVMVFVVAGILISRAAYHSSAKARDEAYYIGRAEAELQEMNIIARIEEGKSGHTGVPYLLCGSAKEAASGIFRPENGGQQFYLNEALPVIYGDKGAFAQCCIRSYGRYFRMPRFVIATEEQEKQYDAVLATMPGWPASGSVKAADGAVLIKIGDVSR